MTYQHPLGYLIAMEGLALLRAWAGDHDYDEAFVRARIAETRRLLADPELSDQPGVHVGRDATQTAYAEWSRTYDDPGNGLFDMDEPVITEILTGIGAGAGPASRDALDVACGTGRLSALLDRHGYAVTGVDPSAAMLDRARVRLPGATFVEGSLERLPAPDGSADVVVCGLALIHVDDLGPAFAEFARVLRPGGHLVISDVHEDLALLGSTVIVRSGRPQAAATHRHAATAYLRAAMAVGFSVRRCEELPEVSAPTGPVPEPTTELGGWTDWPWSLLGIVPEASRAAWNSPALIVWDFVLEGGAG